MRQSCYYSLGRFWCSCFLFLLSELMWNYDLYKYTSCFVHVLCFMCNFKTWHRCIGDNSCSRFHCQIDQRLEQYRPWNALRDIVHPLGCFTAMTPPTVSQPVITLINSYYCYTCVELLFCFHRHIDFKPDKSPGDTAARVLALHEPAGETYPPADSRDLTPQW